MLGEMITPEKLVLMALKRLQEHVTRRVEYRLDLEKKYTILDEVYPQGRLVSAV